MSFLAVSEPMNLSRHKKRGTYWSDLSKLSLVDTKYSCVMSKPTKKHRLHSTVVMGTGVFKWAWVPSGRKMKRLIVFIPDDEPDPEFAVIENFSQPPKKHVRPKTHRPKP